MGIQLTTEFFLGLGGVIVADLVLAGDNAVVIALAARNLPVELRARAVLIGAGAAIVLRAALTVLAVFVLGKDLPFVQLIGGLALLYIGWNLALEDNDHAEGVAVARTLRGAVRTILIADVVMSIDNVLAVSAIARQDPWLVVFGLLVSIPIVMGGANLLLRVIDRYPIIVWFGAALIVYVGVELMFVDPVVHPHLPHALRGVLLERIVAVVVAVIVTSLAWSRRDDDDGPAGTLALEPDDSRLMVEPALPDD